MKKIFALSRTFPTALLLAALTFLMVAIMYMLFHDSFYIHKHGTIVHSHKGGEIPHNHNH